MTPVSFAQWRAQLTALFHRYIPQDPAAMAASVSLVHALWVIQRGFYQTDEKPLPGRAAATLSIVVDLTIGLATNTFMQRHGARVYPLFEAAVRGWISGAYYHAKLAEQDGQPAKTQYDTIVDAQSCIRLYRELALSIVVLATGAELAPEQAAAFRSELTALMETP